MTITADTLQELTGRLTEAAAVLQAGDQGVAIVAELAPLAEAPADNGVRPAAIPTPEPDYQAAGLTEWQAVQARAAAPEAIYVPPQAAVAVAPLPTAPAQAPAPTGPPVCPLGHGVMVWKGGALSKSGKGLPLWSCSNANCREAIWPPR